MTLLEYLRDNYEPNEPILLKNLSVEGYSYDTLRKMLSNYAKNGDIERYCQGVYYFSEPTELGYSIISYDTYLEKKYMKCGKDTVGYYSGLTLLNRYGLSTQVPNIREITTNEEKTNKRIIDIRKKQVVLRKPVVNVTTDNVKYLEFLDIFRYSTKNKIKDNFREIVDIADVYKLEIDKINYYITFYPVKVGTKIKESGIHHEITRKQKNTETSIRTDSR